MLLNILYNYYIFEVEIEDYSSMTSGRREEGHRVSGDTAGGAGLKTGNCVK